MIYKFSAKITISAYTTIEADDLESAEKIAKPREASMILNQDDENECWNIDTDGSVYDIKLERTD